MKIHTNIPGPLLSRLQGRFNTFVETGTAGGDTAELAAIMFPNVFTCDINAKSIKQATARLAKYPNVYIKQEESPRFLNRVKTMVIHPVLYWLDAHWCGGPKLGKECPLLDELRAIGSLSGRSVILIDDIDLMENPPPPPHDPKQWPTLDNVEEIIKSWNDPYRLEKHQGDNSRILAILPKDCNR